MGLKMDDNSYSKKMFQFLQNKIDEAQKQNQPVNDYVRKQIEVLQDAHDEFVATAKKQGYDMKNPKVGDIEVQQYSAMKQLAQKIGLPVEKYDDLIKDVRIRIFGEENYKRFFENE